MREKDNKRKFLVKWKNCSEEDNSWLEEEEFTNLDLVENYLKDLQFKQRQLSHHYITNFINRDYKESTTEQRTKVLKPLSMIYPDKQDLECIIEYLGSALSGISSKEQDTLFLLGLGN